MATAFRSQIIASIRDLTGPHGHRKNYRLILGSHGLTWSCLRGRGARYVRRSSSVIDIVLSACAFITERAV
uniref:Uncharacterized protein n=1 Tax=Onchocerca volvulus TaxID=6282 RepID=A0A8R1XYA9_ONCVO